MTRAEEWMKTAWPFVRELTALRERIDAFLGEAPLAGAGLRIPGTTMPSPSSDVFESNDHVVVVMEVPGVDPDSIDLRLRGRRLRVSGRFGSSCGNCEEHFVRLERSTGSFCRDFRMPADVKDAPVVRVERGVLIVRVPRNTTGQNRQSTDGEEDR